MSILKNYEIKVLYLLASGALSQQQIEALVSSGELASYEHTGSGYFLSIRHEDLPQERIVCHEPIVTGSADGVTGGFIIFIENSQLTMECYTWEDIGLPEGFRDSDVQVAAI
ncbi:MAG: hypothetical protein QOC96_1023 [Acidobacteriota bacterium]|nr:hypothetical protein [Acidobacteriota bacterium]